MNKIECNFFKKWLMKSLSHGLIFLILAGCLIPAVSFADEQMLTRGDAVRFICKAADDYNPDLKETDIIKGYGDGSISEEKPVTRVEAYAMLARAFHSLEPPKGNNLRRGVFGEVFTDIPKWAQADIKKLTDAGLLTAKEEHTLGADDIISVSELQTVLYRLYAYIGTNVKDDLASTINRAWLEEREIPKGYPGMTTFSELEIDNDKKIQKIIDHAIELNEKKGSDSYQVAAFYQSALDTKERNRQGILPLRKYLTLIDQVETMDQLVMADSLLDQETGVCFLIPWSVSVDAKNSRKMVFSYYGTTLSLDKNSFDHAQPELTQALKNMIKEYLVMSGETEKKAEVLVGKIYELEKDLSTYDLDEQAASDVNKTYNMYSKDQFVKLFKGFDMNRALKEFDLGKVKKVNVFKEDLTKRAAKLMTNSNLETWKAWMKFHLLYENRDLLSQKTETISREFDQAYTGTVGQLSKEKKALDLTKNYVGTPIEKAYVRKYCSPYAKKDIEGMADQFIDVYKERLHKNPWLSNETRAMAIKKLNGITVKIGYPSVWPEIVDRAEILAPKKGGTLFRNITAVRREENEYRKAQIGRSVDKDEWQMTAYEVNAYYNPSANEIVFPAGILQDPFYSEKAPKEKNLGGIGTVIAHEITHAFDNNGAAYDEKGNAKNWWTKQDYQNFQAKCQRVIALYDQVEVAPGIQNNGAFTVSENVADLGGLSCALEAAAKLENPDYQVLFENFAAIFKTTRPRESLQYYTLADVHSNGLLRANRAVVNFDQFYQTYDVKEGDGMYLPPEQRVTIW